MDIRALEGVSLGLYVDMIEQEKVVRELEASKQMFAAEYGNCPAARYDYSEVSETLEFEQIRLDTISAAFFAVDAYRMMVETAVPA